MSPYAMRYGTRKTTLFLNPFFVSYPFTFNIGAKVLLFTDTHKLMHVIFLLIA